MILLYRFSETIPITQLQLGIVSARSYISCNLIQHAALSSIPISPATLQLIPNSQVQEAR